MAYKLLALATRAATGRVGTVSQDITQRKELENDLRTREELSEADKRKNEFLATLAHELRGPLAPLTNVLELWKRSTARSNSEPGKRWSASSARWSGSSTTCSI